MMKAEAHRVHRISVGLGKRNFQILSELAAYHGRTPEELILDTLPRVFEKYRVLRLLRERSGKQGGPPWQG